MIRSRSPSRSPPDASTDAFSSSLTTTVFSQRSMRWLEASLRRATPKGHETFIFRTAPHQGLVPASGPPCVQDTLRHPQDAGPAEREDVQEISWRFRAGTPKHVLATEFKISISSIKLLLRTQ